jgi:N-acetylglutamate synthase-like GNAT family acetyltransferase
VTSEEKWGYSKEDFTLMFLMGVGDHYVAEEKGTARRVGIASAYNYGGKLAWIGNVVVSEEYRHKGVATLLLKHAVRHLRKEGVKTVRLYSYQKAEPLYESLGFAREGVVGVFSKPPARGRSVAEGRESEVQADLLSAQQVDLQHLINFDSNCFGSDRQRVISFMIRSEGVASFVKANGRNRRRIIGYIMASEGKQECEIGPWICEPERVDAAEDLLQAIINRFRKKRITLATPLEKTVATNLLQKLGFAKTMDVPRMRKGRNLYNGKPEWIFAVGGLERG